LPFRGDYVDIVRDGINASRIQNHFAVSWHLIAPLACSNFFRGIKPNGDPLSEATAQRSFDLFRQLIE
jgi:hypothetical protein